MADLFGGFGGLMKGLSGLMPQDDPKTQLFRLQSEVSDLKKQEAELYAEIGRRAVDQYGLEGFGEMGDRMNLIRANLAAAENKLKEAQGIEAERERAEKQAKAGRTCPACGYENPDGTRFCQECGGRLGGTKCPSCGADNGPGVKFCSACGQRLEAAPQPAACPGCGEQNPPGTRFCGGCGQRLEG